MLVEPVLVEPVLVELEVLPASVEPDELEDLSPDSALVVSDELVADPEPAPALVPADERLSVL